MPRGRQLDLRGQRPIRRRGHGRKHDERALRRLRNGDVCNPAAESVAFPSMRMARGVVALLAVPVFAAAAFADDVPIDIPTDAPVIPNRAGTPNKPQGVVIKVKGKITIPEAYDPPLVDTIDVRFPKAGSFNGGKFPKCTETVL